MSNEDAATLSIAAPTTRAPDAAAVVHRRVIVGALVVLAWLAWSIGLHPLTLPDEGRYVGVAWEMLRSGNWLIPTENGLPFFHKPPLFYWLTAISMHAFGINAASARLAALVCACLAVAGLFAVTRRRAGEPIATATVLVLATMPFFFAAEHYANLDMPVAAFIALAIVFAADASLTFDDLGRLGAVGPAAFLSPRTAPPLVWAAASSCDLLVLATVFLLVLGFRAIPGLSRKTATILPISLWGLMVLCRMGWAALFG